MEVLSNFPLPRPLRLDLKPIDDPAAQTHRQSTARDHLRIYYSDYLRVPPAHGLRFMDQNKSLVDCEELLNWTAQANKNYVPHTHTVRSCRAAKRR